MPSASSIVLTALLVYPALSSVILPLHLVKNNMATFSSLLAVSDIIISVLSMSRSLPVEVELLKWMNECTIEWWKYTRGACTTIDWRQFAKQYLYWTQLSSKLVFMNFSLWSPAQLQQKLREKKINNQYSEQIAADYKFVVSRLWNGILMPLYVNFLGICFCLPMQIIGQFPYWFSSCHPSSFPFLPFFSSSRLSSPFFSTLFSLFGHSAAEHPPPSIFIAPFEDIWRKAPE